MTSNQTPEPGEMQLAAWLRDAAPPNEILPCTDAEWVALADDVARAGLAAFVLDHATLNNLKLPVVYVRRLRAAAMTVAVRHNNMMRELERVVCAFNRAGIPVMLLKGAALNLTVYERADQRPMSDLDLLVKPENAHEALPLPREPGC